jgi:hypothetical protein
MNYALMMNLMMGLTVLNGVLVLVGGIVASRE